MRRNAYSLKRGTTLNQLKPSETTWNHPETTWNQLKPAILKYLLLKISNSQVEFVLIFTLVFVGQIWSQKLRFSKLTKIWYRGTLLCTYYDFNVYFSKIFVTQLFWANLVPIFKVLKFDTGVHCYMLITISMFSFSKFCHSHDFGQT